MSHPLLIFSQSDYLIRVFDRYLMTNSADPDQLASSATLFAKTGHVVFSKRKAKNINSK